MKCEICEEKKSSKEVLPGIPIICFQCFRRINRIPKPMPLVYYQGFRDGKLRGKREERFRLRRILEKRGREELFEAILR